MNNTNRSLRGFLFPLITLISGLILALVTGYLYLNRIDVLDVDGIYKTILLKNDGTRWILPLLFAAFLTVLAVFCPLFVKKKQTLPEKRDSIPLLFARCLAGAAAIATLIMGFVLSREGTPYVIEYLGSVREIPSFLVSLYEMGVPIPAEAQHYIALLLPILTVPAALYFLLPALFSVKNKKVLFFTGLCALLLLVGELLLTHYFMMEFLSSPTRIFAIFGYSSLAIFLLMDLKRLVYGGTNNRLLAFFGAAAFLFNTADALPRLLLSFVEEGPFSVTLTTFHTLLRLTLGLYALTSLLPLLKEKEKEEENSPAEQTEEAFEEQSEEYPEEQTEEQAEESGEERNEDSAEERDQEEPLQEADATIAPQTSKEQTQPSYKAPQTIEEKQGDQENNG